ncbi:GlxA family transcriptional regulator [Falsiroseomonas selenitidurans]|uniref:GlxA family transcriptional regulator n=1 Tax=Falsiroseomonas selenitidurans TaxID=2716335 RepID=A0ABX1E7L0_9PROT|nr:GlxA family transcriptional regulator [Falsiroseomonas selenitidurans]NKC33174.1 GlxA family transcriptional regulator [Falsiroseomonas selenitidurans]
MPSTTRRRFPASGPPDPRGPVQRDALRLVQAAGQRPQRIGFLLIPGFAMLAYACAMEPLRGANDLAETELYHWVHVSPDGLPVRASNGVSIVADQGIDQPGQVDWLFVCAGGNPAAFDDPATLAWLRAQAARGIRLGGVSGGPYILARAGLLEGHRCTAHWEYIPAMTERFPNLLLTRSLYEVDRDRCTASGGTAALDMMLALIEVQHGRPLSRAVADWFLHTRQRAGDEPQRMGLRERYDTGHASLLAVLERMEQAIEDPLPREALARLAGLSVRQLERIFRSHLGRTIGAHYLGLRLDHARRLLQQTPLSVLEVAMACGFVSAAHFSRAYAARFSRSPRQDRAGVPRKLSADRPSG